MGASSTVRFALVVLWIVAGALQYGFHISALNSTQDSIICGPLNRPLPGLAGAPTCVTMTTFGFGVVTAAFTLGGFFSSVVTGTVADRVGRKRTAVYSAWLIILGGFAMSLGSTLVVLAAGRFIIGLACGMSTVLVPLYLSEVAPPAIRGSVGILTQLSICIGIFFAQVISIPLSALETGNWRFVTLVSAAIAFSQVLTAAFMVESPAWLAGKNPPLFHSGTDEETAPLAPGEDDGLGDNDSGFSARSDASGAEKSMSIGEAIRSSEPAVRKGLVTVLCGQFFQQGSGINAVMYYSTGILSTISSNAKWVTLFTTLVNVFMTLVAVFCVERLGRRALLLLSLSAMSFSSIVLAYSINNSQFSLASVFIVFFVASFSIGLGPIPFLLLGEVPPAKARSACASAALGTNWSANFFIGLLFLPLRNWLSGGMSSGEGTIFYGFAVVSALGFLTMGRLLA